MDIRYETFILKIKFPGAESRIVNKTNLPYLKLWSDLKLGSQD